MTELGLRRGSSRSFGVVGSPVAHSLSPAMHRAAYAELGEHDARYDAYDVPAGRLAGFLSTGEGRDLHGVSVTMPLKREAFELAAQHDEVAADLGIANTLLRLPEGSWRAENHDVHGIAQSLRDHQVEQVDAAAVLGSGATALSAAAALASLGAREVTLCARSPEKLTPLVEAAERGGARVRAHPWSDLTEVLSAEVVVSALAIAGARDVAASVEAAPPGLAMPRVLLDVLYDPWPAPIAAAVSARGTDVASGLEMLAHQAGRQVESMLDVPDAPVPAMLRAARSHLEPPTGPRPSS